MKKIISISVLLIVAVMAHTANYKGVLITDSLCDSKIYPGTVHEIKVYVPQEYDATRPACLYFGLDGILYNAPAVMDSLINTGKMPVTVGVFIQPGLIKDKTGKVIRYNRSNEFDRTDGRFADFIESEVLPFVEKIKLDDGRNISISKDANDRAISGASSGGIAAFNVAWWRPDLFSRVYTTCGTFVAMRGGNELPALVRKTESRPIRIYIHDGSNDAWNPLFGHWYEYNLLMASALEFAGYEHKQVWDDGNHSIKNGSKLFPEAMTYLWEGYPERVKQGATQNNMIPTVLIPGENWKLSDVKFPKPAGIVAVSPDGKIKTNVSADSDWLISAIMEEGKETCIQEYYWIHNPIHCHNNVSAMIYAKDGNLYVATTIGIQICDHNGRVRAIIPYPETTIDAFAFHGNVIFVKIGDKVYTRTINAEAHQSDDAPVEYKSQGQA